MKLEEIEKLFPEVTLEQVLRERKRAIAEGRLKDIETAFGTVSVMKHPIFTETK